MGVATGCGFKEIYRFPHTTYPYSSCICTFLQQHPYFFFHFVKMILRSLYIYIHTYIYQTGIMLYCQKLLGGEPCGGLPSKERCPFDALSS